MNFFISTLFHDPFYFFAWAGLVAFSVCFHEYFHARMALALGDDTAARLGHLTMNPMVQMGPTSLVMLLLIGIAWGAVPVNVGALRSRRDAAIVSFAGPAANLLLGLVFSGLTIAAAFLFHEQEDNVFAFVFQIGAAANAVLFVFNMLPVPMFDGWSVFSLFFPAMRAVGPQQAQTVSLVALLLLFLTPLGGVVWKLGTAIAVLMMTGWAHLFGLFIR